MLTSTATSARVGSTAIDPWPSATVGRPSAATSSHTPASASAVAASRTAIPGLAPLPQRLGRARPARP